MGYVYDRHSFFLQLFHDPEHSFDLPVRQRSGRFVHNQYFYVIGYCLGDFHQLLVGHGQASDRFGHIDFDSKAFHNLPGFLIHQLPVNGKAFG